MSPLDRPNLASASIRLLPHPYPYQAAMAICSDLDRTPDWRVYLEIERFLNTTQTTSMGSGVGLEVGNSIYFDMPPEEFAYWNTDDRGREMARALIHSGHIDCLHSYGNDARQRADAARSLEELERHGCRLQVWVDHSKAPTNFGPDIMVGSGDVKDSPSYHADLTLQYGIRFVWRGRTTGINGQNVPIGPGGLASLFDWRHPLGSSRTIAKEAVKIQLGGRGHPRWEMYAQNRVLRVSTLRDGQPIWEFLRSNPFWKGSGQGDTADGIAGVLTEGNLRTLIRRRGVCILYTHLGKIRDRACPFGPQTQAAFRRLAAFQQQGDICVTTTHRLLRYLAVRDCLDWRADLQDGRLRIRMGRVEDPIAGSAQPTPQELQGLSFIAPRCQHATVELSDGQIVESELHQRGDESIVVIPWRRLVFPDVQAA